jgi:hypothetical protein
MVKLKRAVLLCALLVSWIAGAQNISVSSAVNQNIANFVQNNLIGDGVYVWNVKFQNATGSINKPQIGTFLSNGFPHLQMDSGVVMTTGHLDVAVGPNNSGSLSNAVTGYYTDASLASYASGSLNGCSTLDFDFVSISPFVTMNYCFGSEEYDEYVWSSFNDLFAFLVTGPDPVTGQTVTRNIAIIPHTVSSTNPNGIVVAINSVNGGVGQGGTTTPPTSGCVNCYNTFTQFFVSNTFTSGVQYDGFTQKLSANATLVPCAQYHMHISICNVGDNSYDSGVFLEKKSFNSPSADVSLSHRYADTIERSIPRVLPLTLAGSSYSYGNVTVAFGGDAVVGQDYTIVTDTGGAIDQLHPTFTVGSGLRTLTFRGTPTADLTEPKLIELYLMTSLCEDHPALKTYDTIRFILAEDDVVRLRSDTIVAYDTCKQVGVELAIAKHPPFTFHWDPEIGIDFPYQQYSTATITESRTYQVSVADARGHTDTTDIYVEVRPRTNGVEQPTEAAFEVYPNPTDGEINLVADGITLVEVYNAAGVCVFSRRCNDDCRTVDIRPLLAGLYTVRVTTNLGTKTEKVIVR